MRPRSRPFILGGIYLWACTAIVCPAAAENSAAPPGPSAQALSSLPEDVAPRLQSDRFEAARILGRRPDKEAEEPVADKLNSCRLSAIDTAPLAAEDALSDSLPGTPLRLGIHRALPGGVIDATQVGSWTQWTDGTITWTYNLGVPGAKAVRVHFSRFDLPDGARVVLAGTSTAAPDGYTGRGVNDNGEFWTAPMSGDDLTIQYQAPAGVSDTPIIEIDAVSHLYRDFPDPNPVGQDQKPTADTTSLLSCQQDVNCYAANTTARDAVGAMIFTDSGYTYACTGALLNDVDPNTYAGYFLTANHCLSTQAVVDTLVVYWFYQTDTCNGTVPNKYSLPKSTGGTLLATSSNSDFTFLRLADDPNAGQGFAAWNATTTPSQVIGIHHPEGSYKRISYGALTSQSPTCSGLSRSRFWYLDWTTGITQEGSSGSPLFNSNWEVVGQLYGVCYNVGTTPGCNNPQDYNVVYGKFSISYPSFSSYLAQVTPDDAFEDNDTRTQAVALAGGTYALRLVDLDDYFSVTAVAGGTLSATVTYSTADMSLSLTLLTSSGATLATVAGSGGTAALSMAVSPGTYVLRVNKTHKWGGDYTLKLTPPGFRGDLNGDGDIDLDDFALLQACMGESLTATSGSCVNADLNADRSVDELDVALLRDCLSGEGVGPSSSCTW